MQLPIKQLKTRTTKCENKYGNKLHITRRISSHDFFVGLEAIAGVMLESSARDVGLTADAMLSVGYTPIHNAQMPLQQLAYIHIFSTTSSTVLEKIKNSIVW